MNVAALGVLAGLYKYNSVMTELLTETACVRKRKKKRDSSKFVNCIARHPEGCLFLEREMKLMNDQIFFQVYHDCEMQFQYEQNLRILFGLSGVGVVWRGGDTYELGSAGLLAIDPYELMKLSADEEAYILCLRISNQFLQFAGWQESQHCFLYAHDASEESKGYRRIRELYALIFQRYFQNRKQETAKVNGLAMQLTDTLQEMFTIQEETRKTDDVAVQRLKRILDRVHSEWSRDLSLAELAADEYLSPGYLSRFFQKYLQIPFSQYLNNLRLKHASQMLVKSRKSVTEIAADCGFASSSAFIASFRKRYGMTPGQFRKEQDGMLRRQAAGLSEDDTRMDISVLMEYLPHDQEDPITSSTRQITVAISNGGESFCPQRILNIGYARDGLLAPVQEQITQAQKEIGFTWLRFHGLFDEDMHIYGEDRDGNPDLNFVYVSLLFDFILSLDLIPYIEFSFMPKELAREQTKIFDRGSIITGCTNLSKWKLLVQKTVKFFVDRYGIKEVLRWKFTTIAMSYMHLNCITVDDYMALYCTSWEAVKSVDARLGFGGPGCFAENIDNENGLSFFLSFSHEHACPADFLTVQSYPHVNIADPLFMDYTISQRSAPAILSEDPSFMRHTLETMDRITEEYGVSGICKDIIECNSTLWQRDLSGETCYKAVWIAKNVCETAGQAAFGYWLLTDILEERAKHESVYHGGYGLFTYNGIPKAGYHALHFISKMGEIQLASGKEWMLTGSADGDYQLILYNYCHYSSLHRYRYQRLQNPEEAYAVFESGEQVRFQFHFEGVRDGRYRIEQRIISRDNGSSYDKWMEIGAPRYLTPHETEYLKKASLPSWHVMEVSANGGLHLDITLNPLELAMLVIHHI